MIVRCDHGELFAVCRDCPPWGNDPALRYPPSDLTEQATEGIRLWLTVTAAVLVAFVAAALAWWLGRNR